MFQVWSVTSGDCKLCALFQLHLYEGRLQAKNLRAIDHPSTKCAVCWGKPIGRAGKKTSTKCVNFSYCPKPLFCVCLIVCKNTLFCKYVHLDWNIRERHVSFGDTSTCVCLAFGIRRRFGMCFMTMFLH